MLWGLPQFHKKPKLNHVLTIFWVARITTLANNLCLEHIKPRIQTFPARFLCWRSWTYVFAPFCMDKCIFRKKLLCNLGARWHKILEFVPSCPTYGWLTWWCDFFPVGPAFEDHPQVFGQKKGPVPGIVFLTPAPRPLQVTVSMFVKMNISIRALLQGQMYLQ